MIVCLIQGSRQQPGRNSAGTKNKPPRYSNQMQGSGAGANMMHSSQSGTQVNLTTTWLQLAPVV